jgi:tetratricopeptide (TPR) repeat protein
MIIAFARPVEMNVIPKNDTQIVVAFQNSSNQNPDEFKKNFHKLLDSRYSYSVIIYSDKIYPISAMTKDTQTLDYIIQNTDFETIKSDNIEKYELKKVIQKLYTKDNKIAIIIGNGIKLDNIYTYCINGEKDIADTYITGDLQSAFVIIKDSIDKSSTKKENIIVYDYSKYFIYLSMFFLLLSFISIPKYFYLLVIFISFDANAILFDFAHISKGNTLYKQNRYLDAINEYKKIDNKSPELYYNIANCYYKLNNYQEAINNYNKVLTNDEKLYSKALHNIGNSFFMLSNYEYALKSYESSLKIEYKENTEDNLILTKKILLKNRKKTKKIVVIKPKPTTSNQDSGLIPIVVFSK